MPHNCLQMAALSPGIDNTKPLQRRSLAAVQVRVWAVPAALMLARSKACGPAVAVPSCCGYCCRRPSRHLRKPPSAVLTPWAGPGAPLPVQVAASRGNAREPGCRLLPWQAGGWGAAPLRPRHPLPQRQQGGDVLASSGPVGAGGAGEQRYPGAERRAFVLSCCGKLGSREAPVCLFGGSFLPGWPSLPKVAGCGKPGNLFLVDIIAVERARPVCPLHPSGGHCDAAGRRGNKRGTRGALGRLPGPGACLPWKVG